MLCLLNLMESFHKILLMWEREEQDKGIVSHSDRNHTEEMETPCIAVGFIKIITALYS